MFSNIREKYYAGADNDLHGGDGHVFPPLLLLVKSAPKLQQCWREERRRHKAGQTASGREGTSSDQEDVDDDNGNDAKAEQW